MHFLMMSLYAALAATVLATVDARTLNDGHDAYMLYCFACHGEKGDGHGPASPGMRPPPRDFTLGMFKFAGVPAGGLPHDDDLEALIGAGLAGTPMLPWDITSRERHAIVQYLKHLQQIPGARPTDFPSAPDGVLLAACSRLNRPANPCVGESRRRAER